MKDLKTSLDNFNTSIKKLDSLIVSKGNSNSNENIIASPIKIDKTPALIWWNDRNKPNKNTNRLYVKKTDCM